MVAEDYLPKKLRDVEEIRGEDGKLPAYAWPGGYPIYYLTGDGGVLCPECANQPDVDYNDPYDPQWYLVGYDANYEDPNLYCVHCGKRIESAYADDEIPEQSDSVDKAIDDILGNKELSETYNRDLLTKLFASVETVGLTREDKLALWTEIRDYAVASIRSYRQL